MHLMQKVNAAHAVINPKAFLWEAFGWPEGETAAESSGLLPTHQMSPSRSAKSVVNFNSLTDK